MSLLTQNLFLSGLCYDTNEPILKQAFEKYGEIIEGNVWMTIVRFVLAACF